MPKKEILHCQGSFAGLGHNWFKNQTWGLIQQHKHFLKRKTTLANELCNERLSILKLLRIFIIYRVHS